MHHGEALRALTKDEALVAALEQDPFTAVPPGDRLHTLVVFAIRLTQSPQQADANDIVSLRRAGLSDHAIHDVVAIVSYFNFVNRIASGLGVDLEQTDKEP